MSRAAVADPGPLRVRDRSTGQLVDEKIFGGPTLRFLYQNPVGRFLTDRILSGEWPHRVYGWLQSRPASRRKIPEFASSLGIDVSQVERPLSDYRSLNEFFTRRFLPGARTFDPHPGHLCAPAEGRVWVVSRVVGPLPVKGSQISLPELLGDAELAERFQGGVAVIIRLAPADYHRFHFCDDGVASPWRPIAGRLHSVHPIALAAGAPSFRNRRCVTRLASRHFGELVSVEVGALCVGTIEQTFLPGPVVRGQEKGMFHFGGSTVVLLAEPGRVELDRDLVESSLQGVETLVRLGERMGGLPSAL